MSARLPYIIIACRCSVALSGPEALKGWPQSAGKYLYPRHQCLPPQHNPQVPLGITSTARVWVVNDGYDNAELSVRLPPDTSRLPVSVAFPEGKLIGVCVTVWETHSFEK